MAVKFSQSSAHLSGRLLREELASDLTRRTIRRELLSQKMRPGDSIGKYTQWSGLSIHSYRWRSDFRLPWTDHVHDFCPLLPDFSGMSGRKRISPSSNFLEQRSGLITLYTSRIAEWWQCLSLQIQVVLGIGSPASASYKTSIASNDSCISDVEASTVSLKETCVVDIVG